MGDTKKSLSTFDNLAFEAKKSSGAFVEKHAKAFAEHIIRDGLLNESLGNVGTKTDDGVLGFAKIFEDPKDGDCVALGVATVDEMYERFITK